MLLATSCTSVIVVLGARFEQISPHLNGLPIAVHHNPNWQDGIATSIAAGLSQAGDSDAVLIALCDQPFITTEDYQALLQTFSKEGKLAAAAFYNDAVGVPAVFSRECFSGLSNLKGDVGARRLLVELRQQVALHPLPRAAFDVDTQQDLDTLLPS